MDNEERVPYRLLYTIFLDSCAFYPPQKDQKLARNKLWEFEDKGLIKTMEIAEATNEEIERAPKKLKKRIERESRIINCDSIETKEDRETLNEIEKLLFSNKQKLADNEKRDARNIFCAKKMGCDLFVTVDNCHILKKAEIIKERFRFRVVMPTQCVKIISEGL
jgi:hypothetical protein